MTKVVSINKEVKFILFLIGMLAASWFFMPVYFNHLKDAKGITYANLDKMLADHPTDEILMAAISDAVNDSILSTAEFSSIIDLHFERHGTFSALPFYPGRLDEDLYDRDEYRIKLIDSITYFNIHKD